MTTSERTFERFLVENSLEYEKIAEESTPRPDYKVQIGNSVVLFEVKEIAEDENFKTGHLEVSSRTLGDHVRKKIREAKRQVRFGADQGFPSVLLIYNNLDPIHLWGTEDQDFIAALYGEYTLVLDIRTRELVDSFNGRNHSFGTARNTSFSAVGRLAPYHGKWTVTLFENAFAKVCLPFDQMVNCFEVKRVGFQ